MGRFPALPSANSSATISKPSCLNLFMHFPQLYFYFICDHFIPLFILLYLGENFVWISEFKTWSEAQSFCRMFHTDLASVRNETELQDILRISNGSTVWIGLYRKRLWSDQSSSTFTYWRPQIMPESAEPDNGEKSPGQLGNEHCTAVDHSGYWKDENCLSSFPFILKSNSGDKSAKILLI
uniref:C-type lectin domain-containing protein n=1 Tax=Astyanax mexicanus TaxID=7994 RepID=A0A3B1JSA4_ASTMX